MQKPLWIWGIFFAVVVSLIILDLAVFNKRDHRIDARESLKFTAFYKFIALIFGIGIWAEFGLEDALNYYTGYLVELSLSVDNLFVMSLVFNYFSIPAIYQHRVLFWGIVGVVVLRAIMIGLGVILINKFGWIMYAFGIFLVLTGIKMLWLGEARLDIENSKLMQVLKRFVPITHEIHGNHFWIRDKKLGWVATPLFMALVVIESVDLIFAVDSIPAIFAITTDPFIVYTSNIFAIMGLRSLYFALEDLIQRFHYLKIAVSCVLIFIGGKIFLVQFIGHIPALVSLMVTVVILGLGVVTSIWRKPHAP